MRTFFLILVMVLILACVSRDNSKRHDHNYKIDFDVRDSTENILSDTLSIENVMFNGQDLFIPLSEWMKDKKMDSMVRKDWACGSPFDWMDKDQENDTINHLYYINQEYITNQNMSLLISAGIENNKLELIKENIVIDENTTIEEFSVIFPLSYKRIGETKTSYSDDYDRLIVPFTESQPEDHWIFYFKDNYFIRFELYWWLC